MNSALIRQSCCRVMIPCSGIILALLTVGLARGQDPIDQSVASSEKVDADSRHGADPLIDGFFEKRVAPILIKRCIECHNPLDHSGGLDLTNSRGLKSGGETGEDLTAIDPDANLLWEKVDFGEMPPEERGVSRELADDEKQVLRRWIEAGTPWPEKRTLDLYELTNEIRGGRDWWSFQPIVRPAIPSFPSTPKLELRHPVDAFIHARHLEQGLGFSPPASRRELFRRLSFDVTGLPPDIDELRAFEADADPGAYEKQVDRLLGSPRFGEHQGRDWLDLVRYADTNGYERDAEKLNSWKYRDWVIESLNTDKPFDRFVLQQLAGDQMVPLSEENVVGTTMLRVGTWDDEPNDKLEYKYDRLEDLIHVTSTAFLGLTVKCARCHNHKFDPIPQSDYYRMGSIFWPGDLIGNEPGRVKGFEVLAWSDVDLAREPIRLLRKGNPHEPVEKVEPGFLSVMPALDTPFAEPREPESDSGRRLEFARRLIDRRNPLVARVIVNRIWQHYFGHGIVRSSNNFGYKGDPPTHPQLLDWLASELIAQDWNLKPIHRLILTSRTYRQQSGQRPESPAAVATGLSRGEQVDPLNRFLWRMNRKRLAAEAIRDALLDHSGELNLEMGGRGFVPDVSSAALEVLSKQSNAWQPSPPGQQSRRGVYLFVKRSLIPPLLASFDFADTSRPCGQRDLTIVTPQALALLNNEFVHQQSETFAHSLMSETTQLNEQIRLAWNRVYARDPSEAEVKLAREHYHQQLAFYQQQVQQPLPVTELPPAAALPSRELVMHLDAGFNVQTAGDQKVIRWTDRQEQRFAAPPDAERAPRLIREAIDGRPVVAFNGINQLLEINDQVLKSPEHTVVVVGYDRNPAGSREFFSNWNADGNSTTSVFLGLTDGRLVRYSDQFRSREAMPDHPFLLTALTDSTRAEIFLGRKSVGRKPGGLTGRNLTTRYVIGTQGNFGHEFLDGGIAELLVYDRALDERELQQLWAYLEQKYPGVRDPSRPAETRFERTPSLRALASVCHVLLNSNEAIFVD